MSTTVESLPAILLPSLPTPARGRFARHLDPAGAMTNEPPTTVRDPAQVLNTSRTLFLGHRSLPTSQPSQHSSAGNTRTTGAFVPQTPGRPPPLRPLAHPNVYRSYSIVYQSHLAPRSLAPVPPYTSGPPAPHSSSNSSQKVTCMCKLSRTIFCTTARHCFIALGVTSGPIASIRHLAWLLSAAPLSHQPVVHARCYVARREAVARWSRQVVFLNLATAGAQNIEAEASANFNHPAYTGPTAASSQSPGSCSPSAYSGVSLLSVRAPTRIS
ncbi:hypothetical protein BU23DRAFT_264954 [Bimuria novae-zelandiae CBS 107.79]|uniref:Uncharacterized protein n=1 Tax=Bimuria novae-zelandiae CBS 107.79 TaxID=1447943 RepID=A0A6A5UX42_9PLEO|nr:hypothetical protein BU23DRAFT_264954 [Bimuria novae-zelandiae CBS 107.79]